MRQKLGLQVPVMAIAIVATVSFNESHAHDENDVHSDDKQLILMNSDKELKKSGGQVGVDCFATDLLTYTWHIEDVDEDDSEHIEKGDKLKISSKSKSNDLSTKRKPKGSSLFEPWGKQDNDAGMTWTADCSVSPKGRYVLEGFVEVEGCIHNVLIYRTANVPSDSDYPEILDRKRIYVDFTTNAGDSDSEACRKHEEGPTDIHPGHAHGYD